MSNPRQPGDFQPSNPYASPQGFSQPGQPGFGAPMDDGRGIAAGKVKGPAIGLMVLAPICILLFAIDIAFRIYNISNDNIPVMPGGNRDAALTGAILGAVVEVIAMICQLVIAFGAFKMMKLESYSLSRTACVLSCIPCLSACCIFGIPFGIWGLVMLNDPNVKRHFS